MHPYVQALQAYFESYRNVEKAETYACSFKQKGST